MGSKQIMESQAVAILTVLLLKSVVGQGELAVRRILIVWKKSLCGLQYYTSIQC